MSSPTHPRPTADAACPSSLFADLVAASAAVRATRSRKAKVAAIADALARADPVDLAARFLAGRVRQAGPNQRRLEVGWRGVHEAEVAPAEAPSLTLVDVDLALQEIANDAGSGSRGRRLERLRALLARATADEQALLRGLVLGELRQGALEGVVVQGIAAAARAAGHDLTDADVRRAQMFAADLGVVAEAALAGADLSAFTLVPGRPVKPMLAAMADSIADAVADLRGALVEWKLDGVRVQVHRAGGQITVVTRNLNDVTRRSGAVVAAVADLPGGDLVLDGEVLAVGPDGRPWAFQDTMGTFATDDAPADVPWSPFFFDLLHAGGRDLVDEPLEVRRGVLAQLVPESLRIPGQPVGSPAEGEAVLAAALEHGHEGVVVKDLQAPYAAGRRGSAWRKVKPVRTFDLVVLGVEWGSGRRRGYLSNLHLGARSQGTPDHHPDAPGFVMLGKTFKGMTDEMLAWQTERFLELETGRDGRIVWVRPEQVVEVAVDGVQASTRYPGGVALRFARVRRYRDDKDPSEADTLEAVQALLVRPPG